MVPDASAVSMRQGPNALGVNVDDTLGAAEDDVADDEKDDAGDEEELLPP